jgi:hypothetical protein
MTELDANRISIIIIASDEYHVRDSLRFNHSLIGDPETTPYVTVHLASYNTVTDVSTALDSH